MRHSKYERRAEQEREKRRMERERGFAKRFLQHLNQIPIQYEEGYTMDFSKLLTIPIEVYQPLIKLPEKCLEEKIEEIEIKIRSLRGVKCEIVKKMKRKSTILEVKQAILKEGLEKEDLKLYQIKLLNKGKVQPNERMIEDILTLDETMLIFHLIILEKKEEKNEEKGLNEEFWKELKIFLSKKLEASLSDEIYHIFEEAGKNINIYEKK